MSVSYTHLDVYKRQTIGSSEPQQAFFYNDQQPDKIFYQGLAWRALGRDVYKRQVNYKREYFATNPDNVLVLRLTADKQKSITMNMNIR